MKSFYCLIIYLLLFGCRDPCGKEGGAASTIRSLSEHQKALLFEEASNCPERSNCNLNTLLALPFRWQRTPRIRKRTDKGSVVLGMCFDYGVDLHFSGLGKKQGQITLSYGEFVGMDFGEEVIWTQKTNKAQN